MYIRHGLKFDKALPAIADTYAGKKVIVLGSGINAYAEFDQAREAFPGADIMAVNNSLIGLEFQIRTNKIKIEHWVSAHPEHFYFGDIWMKDLTINHSDKAYPKVHHVWPQPVNCDGSSGLMAVKIALMLGYEKIVIAGIPLDDNRRFYDHQNTVYHMADPSVFQSWMDFVHAIEGERCKICSMGGKTQQIFGGLK